MTPFFFTWTAQRHAEPLDLAGGEGSWFTTSTGERWLDLASLIYQVNAGHGHQRIVEAVCAQARRQCVTAPFAVYPEKRALAEKLLSLAPPGFSKVFFTLGGAEANETALKIARMATGRYKLISRYRSYHGASMGAITLSGDHRRAPVEPGLVGVVHALDLDCALCPHGVRARSCTHRPLSQIPRLLELEGPKTVAAVFIEPVSGSNGVHIPPPGYFADIRRACDAHGTLLVVDEVLTGFGRTGTWFAYEHFDGVVPDMITVGKALTGGYGTLGAVLVHDRVASYFDEHVLCTGLTHYAHPLGVAAALEALRVYEDEGLITRAARLEPALATGLAALGSARPGVVRQSRVIGLLSATELTLPPDGWKRLGAALRRRRVLTHVVPSSQALILSPPLCISAEELHEGLASVAEAIDEAI